MHSRPERADGGQFRELMPGVEGNNERSPWNMAQAYQAPEFLEEMRFWHRLRVNLQPYLWETAQDCAAHSRPMMRPLVYDWPNDPLAIAVDDEFLLGDSLLVAPLLEENAESRTVYLPQGQWIGLFDQIWHDGGQAVTAGGQFPAAGVSAARIWASTESGVRTAPWFCPPARGGAVWEPPFSAGRFLRETVFP